MIDLAIAELESDGRAVEPDVVLAVKRMKVDRWVYLRQTKRFAVFIDKMVENAYEVRALTTPLDELVGEPPCTFEIGVFEYEGVFVCDGLALGPIALGPGYRAQFKAAYTAIRKAGRNALADQILEDLEPATRRTQFATLSHRVDDLAKNVTFFQKAARHIEKGNAEMAAQTIREYAQNEKAFALRMHSGQS